jgi:hypothetical protein
MLKRDRSRSPARFNRLVVQGCELVDLQKARVMALADQPDRGDAVILICELPYPVRSLKHRPGVLIKQLMR